MGLKSLIGFVLRVVNLQSLLWTLLHFDLGHGISACSMVCELHSTIISILGIRCTASSPRCCGESRSKIICHNSFVHIGLKQLGKFQTSFAPGIQFNERMCSKFDLAFRNIFSINFRTMLNFSTKTNDFSVNFSPYRPHVKYAQIQADDSNCTYSHSLRSSSIPFHKSSLNHHPSPTNVRDGYK